MNCIILMSTCLCPNLNNIRSYYFCKFNIDVGKNYMERFVEVLCHSDLKTMASFIYEMWNARNNVIFQKLGGESLYLQHLLNMLYL